MEDPQKKLVDNNWRLFRKRYIPILVCRPRSEKNVRGMLDYATYLAAQIFRFQLKTCLHLCRRAPYSSMLTLYLYV